MKILTRRGLAATFLMLAGSSVMGQAHVTVTSQFAVSDGAATFTIPVRLPPGVAGLQPSLSLNYSSQAGNGLVGVGWSLGGLSSVTRCPRTMPQDGIHGAVSYDLNDRYCLNGQRLIAVSGSDGGHGSEYRTERESFAKVVSYNEAGATHGPSSFVVKTADGLTMEYGLTADSRIEAQGKAAVVVWALNKVSDANGNYYTVTYVEDNANGDWRPSTVSYTGNTSTGTPPQTTISFGYSSRGDVISTYQAGSRSSTQVRLSTISMTGGSSYRITYGQTELTGLSRVSMVEQCASANNCNLPAVVPSYAPGEAFSTAAPHSNLIAPTEINGGGAVHIGDWNGDGRVDFMWFRPSTGDNRWYLSQGELSFVRFLNPIPPAELSSDRGAIHVGDWNSDGVTDFLWYERLTGNNRWYMGNPGALGFTVYSNLIAPTLINEANGELYNGDWNGDGRLDLMWYDRASGSNRWFVSSGAWGAGAPSFTAYVNPIPPLSMNGGTGIHFGDWNGDGAADLLWFDGSSGTNRWFTNDRNMGFSTATNRIASTDINGGRAIQLGDWNADGLTDLLWYNTSGNTRWYLNNGAGGFTRFLDPIAPSALGGSNTMVAVGDWNGDGVPDLLWYDSYTGNNRWFLNNGALKFSAPRMNVIAASELTRSNSRLLFGDWNGDGLSDFVYFSEDDGQNKWYLNRGATGFEATQIDGGLGQVTQMSYGALPQLLGSQYMRDSQPSYPKIQTVGPMRVVTQVSSPNGVGGMGLTRYTYGNLLVELGPSGRGSLGFGWTQSQNMQTGSVKRTYFRQDWPYLGLVSEAGTGTGVGPAESNWKNLTHTVNTSFTCRAATGSGGWTTCGTPSPNTRYFIYPNQIDARAWDYTGMTASDGVFIALPRNRTTQTLNDYGEVTWLRTETFNPDGSASGYSKTTTNTYAPVDPAKWHLNRLIRSSVEATSP